MHIFIYVHVYIYICVYIQIYTHICRRRRFQRVCVYICIYIYMYTQISVTWVLWCLLVFSGLHGMYKVLGVRDVWFEGCWELLTPTIPKLSLAWWPYPKAPCRCYLYAPPSPICPREIPAHQNVLRIAVFWWLWMWVK